MEKRIRFRYAVVAVLIAALASSGLTFAAVQRQNARWDKLEAVYKILDKQYIDPLNTDKLVDGAVDGMMKSLEDPYTVYMNVEESKGFGESISSSFVGIGAEVEERDGKIVIVSPIKGAPAEKAGLKPNDRIVKVGDTSLEGMKTAEAVKLMRGEKGTKAELTVERPGETELLQITIVRDTIPVETVHAEMKENGIGVIGVSKVSENTAKEFAIHLAELKGQGLKGLVLDLRQNPGGLLDRSLDIAGMLLPKNKVVLKMEGRGGNRTYLSKGSGSNPDASDIPITVLIDGGTASAGEILAGALQESGGAKLVGEKTYGKGTAQGFDDFPDGSTIKYTNAKWLTPSGKWIHKTGISPDVEVPLPEYASLPYVNPDKEWKQDDFGTEVRSIQIMLAALGFDPGRRDGYFDTGTAAAVTRFQTAQGITADGKANGATVRKMTELLRAELKKNDPQMQAAMKLLEER